MANKVPTEDQVKKEVENHVEVKWREYKWTMRYVAFIVTVETIIVLVQQITGTG